MGCLSIQIQLEVTLIQVEIHQIFVPLAVEAINSKSSLAFLYLTWRMAKALLA